MSDDDSKQFDAELGAMRRIIEVLRPFSPQERARVLVHAVLLYWPEAPDRVLFDLVRTARRPAADPS